MKAHERILCALEHEEPDRVPTFTQHLEPGFVEKYDREVELKDDYGFLGLAGSDGMIAKEIGFDSKWVHISGLRPQAAKMPDVPKELLDKHENARVGFDGVIYVHDTNGETWYQDGVLKTPELIKEWIDFIRSFEYPDDEYYRNIQLLWEHGCSIDMVPIPTTGNVVYITWASIGLNRLGYFMRKNRELVSRLMNTWADKVVEHQNRLFEKGIDMCFICDDHAFKNAMIFSPDQFKEIIVPVYRKISHNAHKHNAKFLLHTDGYLHDEIPFLIEANVDAIDPLEYEAGNRLGVLKEKYGKEITLIGNVPTSDLLCFGTEQQVIDMVISQLKEAAEGGGYILAPGSDIVASSKVGNVIAMIKAAKEFGRYNK
jgi:hypothetical protein